MLSLILGFSLLLMFLSWVYTYSELKYARSLLQEQFEEDQAMKSDLNSAWEQGLDDQQELYEQQMLSMQDTINSLTVSLKMTTDELLEKEKIAAQHENYCLPLLKNPFSA